MVFNCFGVSNRKHAARVPSSRWDMKLCVAVIGLCAKTSMFKTKKDTVLKLRDLHVVLF